MNFENLRVGDQIEYTGELIVMRDAAHKRLKEIYISGKELPIKLDNKIIFYARPAKKPDFQVIGAIGPTTSNRMDKYLEFVYKLGVIATIGKGKRSLEACKVNKKYKKHYFITPSGMAALLSQKVKKYEILAFEDLGTEAIQRLFVEKFPLMVGIDKYGKSLW